MLNQLNALAASDPNYDFQQYLEFSLKSFLFGNISNPNGNSDVTSKNTAKDESKASSLHAT